MRTSILQNCVTATLCTEEFFLSTLYTKLSPHISREMREGRNRQLSWPIKRLPAEFQPWDIPPFCRTWFTKQIQLFCDRTNKAKFFIHIPIHFLCIWQICYVMFPRNRQNALLHFTHSTNVHCSCTWWSHFVFISAKLSFILYTRCAQPIKCKYCTHNIIFFLEMVNTFSLKTNPKTNFYFVAAQAWKKVLRIRFNFNI